MTLVDYLPCAMKPQCDTSRCNHWDPNVKQEHRDDVLPLPKCPLGVLPHLGNNMGQRHERLRLQEDQQQPAVLHQPFPATGRGVHMPQGDSSQQVVACL